MTAADVRLELRQPRWARAWFVAFPIFMGVVVLSGVVPLRGDTGWPSRLFFVLFAAALGWRLFRVAAIGTADGRLVVRNHWRDRTLHRDDVADVTVGRVHGGLNRSVRLYLRDGSTVLLDVTEVPFSSRRLERHTAEVREWVSGRPRPFR